MKLFGFRRIENLLDVEVFFKTLGFYLNCEHVLFVYILKQRKKNFADFIKKNRGFSKIFTKIKSFKHNFFKILINHKSFLGSRDVLHKIWA